MLLKEIYRNTASLKLVRFRENYWSDAINIGNVFSHITLKKGVCDFPDVGWIFSYTLLNFDVFNVHVSYY